MFFSACTSTLLFLQECVFNYAHVLIRMSVYLGVCENCRVSLCKCVHICAFIQIEMGALGCVRMCLAVRSCVFVHARFCLQISIYVCTIFEAVTTHLLYHSFNR